MVASYRELRLLTGHDFSVSCFSGMPPSVSLPVTQGQHSSRVEVLPQMGSRQLFSRTVSTAPSRNSRSRCTSPAAVFRPFIRGRSTCPVWSPRARLYMWSMSGVSSPIILASGATGMARRRGPTIAMKLASNRWTSPEPLARSGITDAEMHALLERVRERLQATGYRDLRPSPARAPLPPPRQEPGPRSRWSSLVAPLQL